MIVFDASALVEVVLRTNAGRQGRHIMETEDVVAPELIDVEVLAALTNYEKRGELDAARVDAAVTDLLDAPVDRITHRPLLEAARERTGTLSAHDAVYVALASALDCGLVTADARLARTSGLNVAVTLLRHEPT